MSISAPPRPPRPGDPISREEAETLVEALIEEARQRARRRRQRYAAFAVVATLAAVVVTTVLERSTGAESQSPALAARSAPAAGAADSKIVFTSFVVPLDRGSTTYPVGVRQPRYLPGLYVMNANGSGEQRLARGTNPAWSPAGRSLAFDDERNGNYEVYVMNADGSRQRNLTRNPAADDVGAAWSPDGRKIAFLRSSVEAKTRHGSVAHGTVAELGPGDIYVMNADGSGQRRLTRTAGHERSPAWSPDGRKIAFTRSPGGVYVMNADGSGKRRLAAGTAPSWSPDGRKIAFTRSPGGIYVMNADGSGKRRLAAGTAPSWSPDGQTILFERSPFPHLGSELFVMNADGSGLRTLGVVSYGASWSPDGRQIAFAAGVGVSSTTILSQLTGPDIYVMNADGSGLRQLTRRPGSRALRSGLRRGSRSGRTCRISRGGGSRSPAGESCRRSGRVNRGRRRSA